VQGQLRKVTTVGSTETSREYLSATNSEDEIPELPDEATPLTLPTIVPKNGVPGPAEFKDWGSSAPSDVLKAGEVFPQLDIKDDTESILELISFRKSQHGHRRGTITRIYGSVWMNRINSGKVFMSCIIRKPFEAFNQLRP
jgi:hypothetical protein